jgi:adenylate cyclase
VQETMIYELIGRRDGDVPTEKMDMIQRFSRALDLYFKQDWDEAIKNLSGIHRQFPSDRPTSLYAERCERFQQDPPNADWNGITYFESK